MRAAEDAPEWYRKVETGVEVFMSAWSTKRVNETNARHASELFATLQFELPWCRFKCRRRVAGEWGGVLSDSRTVPVVVWSWHLVCLACLFICLSDMRGGYIYILSYFIFSPSPPIRSGGAFSSVIVFPLFLLFYSFFVCSDGMEREACICDHGLERSDLCAEIIIIIIIMALYL